MLRKLMKHEFRATGRIMLPMYLVLLIVSVLANFSIRGVSHVENRVLLALGSIITMLLFAGIFAVVVMTLVLMVRRFSSNILGDEGYITMTLPASVHQQIWAKIIVSAVWNVISFLVVMLAAFLTVFRVEYMKPIFQMMGDFFRYLLRIDAYYTFNITAVLLEGIVLCFLACVLCCLVFYASLAIGHSFANHKTLLSVAFFILFIVAQQILGTFGLLNLDLDFLLYRYGRDDAIVLHAFMGLLIVAVAIYCAIFYVITAYFLKRRLNLE